ncbi:P-loop containing nucleoside triphosphate hydrolase protein [Flammula alnicola]|nr:P-loop containing nucleoside triphosphate hydrolase protein [Flammula alnicola]
MYNVRYGWLDATEEEVKEAVHKANVHETIERLPDGYSTMRREKQRLAVARVMLKDPPIVFFDEPISALNAHTELMKNINTALLDKARTSIFIAHKLRTTVVEADLIIVLKEGEVVEQGTHEELMRTTSSNYEMGFQISMLNCHL